ncbi:hypothetical protein LCGC14_2326740 [marine sediment metagenome]|uniref:Uncharacterized protein n=1 Tax=marine sediment metagenome TaxID=412755 RepID=A0A0F9D3Q4_9ZZZZ
MKDLKDKAIIQGHILRFFAQLQVGDVFKSGQLVRYVNARVKHRHYPDTILRYTRLLREEVRINYSHTGGKASCQFKKISPMASHSL